MATSYDLGQIDTTKPDGSSQTVSVLDDYQRETRGSLVQWAGVEHDLKGRHKIPSGNTASRPSAGGASPPAVGSLYFNNQTGSLEYYNGSVWLPISSTAENVNYAFNGNMNVWDAANHAPYGWGFYPPQAPTLDETTYKMGSSSVQGVATASNFFIIEQTITALFYGIEWWKGKSVSMGAWIKSSTTNAAIQVTDGVGGASANHSGSGNWEWVQTGPMVVASTAAALAIRCVINMPGGTAWFDGVRLSIGTSMPDYILGIADARIITFGGNITTTAPPNYYYPFSNSESGGISPGVECCIQGFSVYWNHPALSNYVFNMYGAPAPGMTCTIASGSQVASTFSRASQYAIAPNSISGITMAASGSSSGFGYGIIYGYLKPQA
jgi:hypothetical protein